MAYRNPEISALHDRLQPHNTLNPPDAYWIESSDGDDSTGGLDFCFECGEEHVGRLNLYTPGSKTHELMMGDSCGNHDSIPHCDICGVTLAGWPTDYCESEELGYFEDERDLDPAPENIHVLSMILWNLQWSEDAEEVSAWCDVAARMAAKLPALEEVL